jgi:hypothetical protein
VPPAVGVSAAHALTFEACTCLWLLKIFSGITAFVVDEAQTFTHGFFLPYFFILFGFIFNFPFLGLKTIVCFFEGFWRTRFRPKI